MTPMLRASANNQRPTKFVCCLRIRETLLALFTPDVYIITSPAKEFDELNAATLQKKMLQNHYFVGCSRQFFLLLFSLLFIFFGL